MSLVRAGVQISEPPEVLDPAEIANRLNKIGRAVRTAAIDHMRETFNLSRPVLGLYMVLNRARASNLAASVRFRLKGVPLEFFNPRIEMRPVPIHTRRGTRVQRLPHVIVKRYTKRGAHVIPGAFPLRQRTTGRFKAGSDRIRKRISAAREKLTRMRFYVFPQRYLYGDLLPFVKNLATDRLAIDFRNTVRTTRRGQRVLRAGRPPSPE